MFQRLCNSYILSPILTFYYLHTLRSVSYTHLDVYKRQALGSEVDPYTIVFVDDILVVSKTLDEHIEHLSAIFHKFRQANVTLNLDKCEFIKSSIQFLGHIISSSGIQPDPTKISSITKFPIPKNLKGLRAFLGLTG